MNPGDRLRDMLLADPAVAAMVDDRVYPLIMPETTKWPVIVYTKVSEAPERVLAGATRVMYARYQVDSWATTVAVVNDLAASIQAALDGYVGDDVDDLKMSISAMGTTEAFDEVSGLYHTIMELLVCHEVEVPA